MKSFQKIVWDFYKKNKRSFPWRETQDPYKILVSEVMLQQTQADRVVRYYERWLKRFPDIASLAKASFSEIYPLWQGLGYNRRGLALKKAAEKAVAEYGGKLPKNVAKLEEFPGVGPYTARAVSIFSFNAPIVCIETNIRRVFIYHFFKDKKNIEDEEILTIAEKCVDAKNNREWHWALMDYGAYLKTQIPNPNRRAKNYSIQSKFEGSLRQIRGRILKNLATGPKTVYQLKAKKIILQALEKEGLVTYKNKKYCLA